MRTRRTSRPWTRSALVVGLAALAVSVFPAWAQNDDADPEEVAQLQGSGNASAQPTEILEAYPVDLRSPESIFRTRWFPVAT